MCKYIHSIDGQKGLIYVTTYIGETANENVTTNPY